MATPQCVRVAGRDMERIAVMHHQGHTPESGHYTATVAPEEDLAYFCDDEEVAPRRQLSWPNGYLIFLRKTSSSDTHPAAVKTDIEERCGGDAPPAPCNDSNASRMEEIDSSEAEAGSIDSEGSDKGMDDQDTDANSRDDTQHAAVEYQVQATECRTTSSRHDDWLHRGALSCRSPVACIHHEGKKNTEAF